MEIKGLSWLGTRAEKFDEMVDFSKNVLGLKMLFEKPGVAFFELANGDQFEIFTPEYHGGGHPPTGVAGAFEVDDVDSARAELLAAGRDVGEVQTHMGYRWAYFTAPDGNAYLVLSAPEGGAPELDDA